MLTFGVDRNASTSLSGLVMVRQRVSTSSKRCSMRSIMAWRWWFSDDACRFSGLSEEGRITVPVNRFASPPVETFALEIHTGRAVSARLSAGAVDRSLYLCLMMWSDPLCPLAAGLPAPPVEDSVMFATERVSSTRLMPISRSRSLSASAIGLFRGSITFRAKVGTPPASLTLFSRLEMFSLRSKATSMSKIWSCNMAHTEERTGLRIG